MFIFFRFIYCVDHEYNCHFGMQSLPDIAWGKRSRVVLDVGCGEVVEVFVCAEEGESIDEI